MKNLAAILALLLAACCASQAAAPPELLRNHEFKNTVAAAEVAETLAKSGLAVSGDRFPRFWHLSCRKPPAEQELSFDRAFHLKKVRDLMLYQHNFRLPRSVFKDGRAYRLALTGSGRGSVAFGFYCYNEKRAFGGNDLAGSGEFRGENETVRIDFTPALFKENVFEAAPYFRLTGDFVITAASLIEIGAAPPDAAISPPPADRPGAEVALQAILDSSDPALLIQAAGGGNRDLRNRACFRLGELGPAALPAGSVLKENVTDYPFEPVRVQAATALTQLGPGAYPLIREILLGGDRNARLTMATAVRGMAGGVPPELRNEVDWANPPVMQTGPSLHPDGGFEAAADGKLVGWEVLFKEGATGAWTIDAGRAREGRQSLKLTKTNGLGYIMLRSTQPVVVPPGRGTWTFRAFFQCFDARYNTLLLPRLETENGGLIWDDTALNRSAGWQSQSLLRNTPPHVWDRRMIMFRQRDREMRLRPALIFYGNPATVWLDELEFPAPPWQAAAAGPTPPQPDLTLEQALAVVAKRPPATAEVKKIDGRTALLLDGQRRAPILYLATRGYQGDFKLVAQDGGIQLPVVRLSLRGDGNYPPFREAWSGRGEPDFSGFFEVLERAVRMAPESHLILGLGIDWPADFLEANPDEAWLDEAGRRGWGQAMHLRGFAAELPPGKPDNPNIWWPSQYSEKAFGAAEKIVRQFLTELKEKPYAKIIAGVFVSGGHDGQFMIHRRDYSAPAVAAWRAFLAERYGDDAALARAWNRPDARIAEAPILPDKPPQADNAMFYPPASHRAYADFREFEERQIWKNSERFARAFKEIFGRDKLALTWCMGGGWRKNFAYFFASPYLDAFVGQPSYEYRYPGSSGGFNAVPDSCSHHGKLAVAELDTRNWMRGIYNELVTMRIGTPTSAKRFADLVMKDGGRMAAGYQGYWFFDIGGNAYRHPAALEVIRQTGEAVQWVAERAGRDTFRPDVALVYHQPSIYWEAPWSFSKANFPSYLIDYQLYQLRLSGVPCANYYLRDLMANPEFRRHKVYVFLNAFMLNEPERKFIRDELQKDGRILVWNYAPGFLSDRGLGVDGVSELVGMRVGTDAELKDSLVEPAPGDRLSANLPPNVGTADVFRRRFDLRPKETKHNVQRFRIEDAEAVTLAKYRDDGSAALAVRRFRDWTSVYSAQAGGLDAELLHNIAAEAGAYTLTRPGLIVDMNGNFISLHAFAGGVYQLKLPRRAAVLDALTRRRLADAATEFELDIQAGESRWLLLE